MKPIVSLITPTHRTDKLFRLYESIKAQTNKRFEWIIIPNGNADISVIPSEKWIKIIPRDAYTFLEYHFFDKKGNELKD